jgi:hypothetical protein
LLPEQIALNNSVYKYVGDKVAITTDLFPIMPRLVHTTIISKCVIYSVHSYIYKIIDNVFGTCKQKLSFSTFYLFNFVLCVAVNNKSQYNKKISSLGDLIKENTSLAQGYFVAL